MDSKMGVDHQDAVELIANSKNVSKRAKIRFQGYHHVRPALMEKRLMGIISLDMKGLSHAMMDMFCANDRKDIGQLRELVIDNSVRHHNFRIILVVKTILRF